MAGRIDLAGGDEAFVDLLDRFFGYRAPAVTQPGLAPAVTEMATGYALGRFEGLNNEPDMEAPWAYYYAGRPDRTAEVVHAAIHQQFGTGRGGLPGNDDSGGLSSWYVWASLGLFPVAGQNLFLIGPPSFGESRIRVSGGDALTIETRGFTEPHRGGPAQYVQSVEFNGAPLTRTWLRGTEVQHGGTLSIALGPEPGDWGTNDRPPSVSSSAT
jgi:putative alpha-1,2-mannosidase